MFLFDAWKNSDPSVDEIRSSVEFLCKTLDNAVLLEDKRDSLFRLAQIGQDFPLVLQFSLN